MLRRLLLLLLLAPLWGVLLVAALNPRPSHQLRLLIWQSPPLPIGLWIALGATGGALISGTAAGLALRGETPRLQRQVRLEREDRSEPWTPPERGPFKAPESEAEEASNAPARSWAWPKRAPQDPAPTVSVPFRVIRKGSGVPITTETAPAPKATATAAGDGWETSEGDDW